jgi:hypothetical protein
MVAKALTKQYFWKKEKKDMLRERVLIKNAVFNSSSDATLKLFTVQPYTSFNDSNDHLLSPRTGICTKTVPTHFSLKHNNSHSLHSKAFHQNITSFDNNVIYHVQTAVKRPHSISVHVCKKVRLN